MLGSLGERLGRTCQNPVIKLRYAAGQPNPTSTCELVLPNRSYSQLTFFVGCTNGQHTCIVFSFDEQSEKRFFFVRATCLLPWHALFSRFFHNSYRKTLNNVVFSPPFFHLLLQKKKREIMEGKKEGTKRSKLLKINKR